jgi:hypothetical protein
MAIDLYQDVRILFARKNKIFPYHPPLREKKIWEFCAVCIELDVTGTGEERQQR